MPTAYLNPLELFALVGPDLPESTAIRKAYKRFLTELTLDDRSFFKYYGQTFSKDDLEQAVELSKDDIWLAAFHFAASNPPANDFLTQRKISVKLTAALVTNPRFQPLLKPYFSPAFSTAFKQCIQRGYSSDVRILRDLDQPGLGLSSRHLYEPTYQELERRAEKVVGTISMRASSAGAYTKQGRGMSMIVTEFRAAFPRKITASLPEYFGSLFNEMVRELNEPILLLFNKQRRYGQATTLVRELQTLPHLSLNNRNELSRLAREMTIRNSYAWANTGREKKKRSVSRIAKLVIVLIFLAYLIYGAFGPSSSGNKPSSYRLDNFETPSSMYTPANAEPSLKVSDSAHLNRGVERAPLSHYLGQEAWLPENYSLRYEEGLPESKTHGLTTMHLYRDENLQGAILVWQDTFGLRQLLIRPASANPTTIRVADGYVDQLRDAYLIIGSTWGETITSPWNSPGWFSREVAYFRPRAEGFKTGNPTNKGTDLWLPLAEFMGREGTTMNRWIREVSDL